MKVRILIEFEVSGNDDDEATAKAAASLAAYHNLVLTKNGQDVTDIVKVHVDGHGECLVRVGEDHE